MLIHAGVVCADTDADPMDYRIKLFARKRVPRSLQNIHPVLIALREDELVLDLEIELGFTTVENAFNNDVIEQVAECRALRLNTGGEFTRKAAYWCFAEHCGDTGGGHTSLKVRSPAAR
jgi:hypothetical protein